MAQPQLLQVKLSRFDAQPWGFRLQGGTDFAQPLLVQKVNAGSLSEQAGLQPGDAVVKINDVDVFNLRHKDAQDIVVRSGNNFVITVQRGGSTWRPHVTPTGNVPQPNSPYLQTVTKTSLAHKQQDSQHIGCGYNNAARPFSNGGDGGVKSIVNKQYNTPVGIYSDESIAETLSAQAEVLAGGVLGVNFKKNEKEYQGDRSEVLKFLREEETGQSTPEPHSPANFYWTQSHAIGGNERRTPLHHQHQQLPLQQQQPDERIGVPLQSNTLAPEASHRPSLPVAQKDKEEQTRQDQEQADPRIIVMPICPTLQGPEYKAEMEAAAAALAIDQDGRPRPLAASGHPACQLCGVGIVGVFVRIKDKNLHVECFKCATCGTSLKNQGYYNFNNKLYCDIHAKQAAINNPPSGTEGYVPVPIKPNTKLSASTISSALNSHGYGGNSNGYSNGNSAPAPAPPESESSQELPLPPPPSPTQLLQYEAEQLQQVPPEQHLSTTQQQQHQHKQEHTRTHSSLSSISSGSSSSGVGGSGSGSGSGSGVGQSQQSYSSTLSLDRFGSPMHSRQTSGSSTSLEAALAGPAAGQGDNYTMQPPSPPPPPPPQTQSVTNYRLQAAQNENDMNTQNKSPNAYNQLLKEYSNKLQQQHHNTTQHTTATATPAQRHNNTAKPFGVAATTATATATTTPTPHQHLPHQQHQQQPLVAALTATLANQLKFNPHQVASPQATATVATSAATPAAAATAAIPATPLLATATDTPAPVATSDNMSAYVADEPSSIYGQINTNSGAVAPPPQASIVAGGSDQPFEYVTLTGNVIRSVQAPGKGAGPSYKVNQGYARPFGAAAPKSPVSYPPQQQQQSPRPAPGGNNPYATLPRSNVGQQDELVRPDQALTPTRPYTPSLTNKPAPIVPFYQTEEKLVFEECSATHARNYNELNASPFPDRTRSPAPGPPPNPLNAIRAPRMKEPEPKSTILSVSGAPRLQTGSITTGQSYQGQLLAHSEQSSQSASQSFTQQPQRITEQRVGNLNIQQREQSSQLQQQAQSQSQSQTRSQVGNTQIERRRKVTEEFERTQSAKTIEIRTGSQSITQSQGKSQSISQAQAQSQSQNQSDTERRSSYGKTGFVANQAKRLSCLEQEISSLTSQSQAISARASALGEGCFPNLRSPTFDSKFPLKPAPVESTVPGYGAVPAASNKLMAPPPGFLQQQQLQQQQKSAFSGYQATTSSVQQSSYASSSKATSSSLSSSSASASASASVARSSQSLTQASAITTTTNNQATTAYRSSNGSNIKPNLASRPSIASITGSANAPAPAPAPFAAPIKATAPFKTPIAPKSVIANAVNAAAPPAPAVFPPDLSDLNLNSNVPDSPGAGGKSAGAFGATSAPKRGRGILNKAAGPGVRIPLCNSCNVQIRGPFITALGRIWCPDHFICVNGNCRRPLQDIGFVEEKGDLYCEYCFEKYLAPTCSKCAGKIKGDCLNAIGKHFHPECFTCGQCGKIFGNRPFFLEDGNAYCEADWNELFTTKCFACGFPVEAGDRWVEALNHNYHSQCFNCTFCKQNLEGQSFYNKGGRPFCKNHAR
ncbi:PDZ and LIM domain protein Zasp isoform X10 [Drosophila eugracilis]|uniref:PDZ and LIM domain protein Zasp isoform X10 n=1 Tax=Drosophila eugracilis TaxID=29029 RepID=UPI0007E618F4|nr:PDZ and LIM domain protein Zasp isoform X10 [Drosophila eugracilis]